MDKTIEQLSQDLARAGYAKTTRVEYRKVAERLGDFCSKPIIEISRDELRGYVEVITEQSSSPSHLSRQLCAILFLFRRTLGKPELVSFIKLPRRYSKLPVVLSQKEVDALLNAIQCPRYQSLAMVMYGAGLRIAEAIALTVDDIDGARGVICVKHGKGDKPREAKLSESLYQWLRQYWSRSRPPLHLPICKSKRKAASEIDGSTRHCPCRQTRLYQKARDPACASSLFCNASSRGRHRRACRWGTAGSCEY